MPTFKPADPEANAVSFYVGDSEVVIDQDGYEVEEFETVTVTRLNDDGEEVEDEVEQPIADNVGLLLALRAHPDVEEDGSESPGPTLKDLRARAAELDIEGRSSMNKEQLEEAIAAAEAEEPANPEE